MIAAPALQTTESPERALQPQGRIGDEPGEHPIVPVAPMRHTRDMAFNPLARKGCV